MIFEESSQKQSTYIDIIRQLSQRWRIVADFGAVPERWPGASGVTQVERRVTAPIDRSDKTTIRSTQL